MRKDPIILGVLIGLLVALIPFVKGWLRVNRSDNSDWRLMGQEGYLKGKKLTLMNWTQTRDDWDHDHCDFCGIKFMDKVIEGEDVLTRGYTDEDEYTWVCEKCYEDFRERFNWS